MSPELAALSPIRGAAAGEFSYCVPRNWCSRSGFYGGATLAVLVAAMEQTAARPLLSASAQFQGSIQEGDALALDVRIVAAGKSLTHALATATLAGKTVASASGVLGQGEAEVQVRPVFPADARRPLDSPPRISPNPQRGMLYDTLEVRIESVGPLQVRFWSRCPFASGQALSSAILAVLADHPPPAVVLVMGGDAFGLSLDTTLHVIGQPGGRDAGKWHLVVVGFEAVHRPFISATTQIWTEDGQLVGLSTQSMIVRNSSPKPQ